MFDQGEQLRGLGIAVVGGGIVGRCVALALQRRGAAVTLIDPDEPTRALPDGGTTGPASFGNAGHLAPEQIRPLVRPATVLRLPLLHVWAGGALEIHLGSWRVRRWVMHALRAIRRSREGERALASLLADAMPAWSRLAELLGEPGLVRADGHLVLWPASRRVRAAAATTARSDAGTAAARMLDPHAAADAASLRQLGDPGDRVGVAFSGTGQVASPARVMAALRDAFERAGGTCVRGRAGAIGDADGRVEIVVESGEPSGGAFLRADAVVVACGLGAPDLLAPLGVALPLIAERGYHVEWSPGQAWSLPPCVFDDRSMIVTGFDGEAGRRLRASSFVEISTERAPPDPRRWETLERHVRALGLPVVSGFDRWMGARPTLPDYLPALGRVAAAGGVFVACGHQHLGLTLAPRTAEVMADIVAAAFECGPGPDIDLAPFRPERFARPGRARAGRGGS